MVLEFVMIMLMVIGPVVGQSCLHRTISNLHLFIFRECYKQSLPVYHC